jgi:uncharacterized membrane protein YhiD involved in acid resistance
LPTPSKPTTKETVVLVPVVSGVGVIGPGVVAAP